MKISLLILSWFFSCLHIQRIGIKYTAVYRSVVLKNNTLGTVDIIFITKLQLLIFSFFWFTKLSQVYGSMYGSMLFLTKYETNLVAHDFCSPSHYNAGGEGGRGDFIWKIAKILRGQTFFLHLWQDKPLWVELKTNGRVIFITILLHFHYFNSLETARKVKCFF